MIPRWSAMVTGMRPVVGPEFGKNVGDVVFDRCLSDRELVRDLLIGIACTDQAKHIDFTRTQLIVGGVFGQLPGTFGRISLASSLNCADRFQQFGVKRSLSANNRAPALIARRT